jgi:DNA-binding NarL/FixJ family response regulator
LKLTKGTQVNSQTKRTKIQTVIAARPGVVREALRAMLTQFPLLEVSGIASGSLSTLDLVRKHRPALLVIDSGLLQDEVLMLLEQSKQMDPQIQCLVLVGTHRQQEVFQASGADIIILRSEPTERLEDALRNLVC